MKWAIINGIFQGLRLNNVLSLRRGHVVRRTWHLL
jgi:hypothetical protein